jgi:electron transport complex protein RnfG
MGGIVKMVVVLSVICGLAGFTLSFLKQSMSPLIEEQVLTYVQKPAIESVLANVDNDPIAERKKFTTSRGREVMVFPAVRGGKLYGVALEEFSPGYGGDVGVIVGLEMDRPNLIGIGITTMRETPGMGTRIAQPKFAGQFKESPLDVNLASRGGKIDAVAGSTISSAAAVDSVRKAVQTFEELKPEIAAAWQ